jgi:putative hemolysin
VLSVMKRLPQEGDWFAEQGWRFEVVDMDGRKIDKLLVAPMAGGVVADVKEEEHG